MSRTRCRTGPATIGCYVHVALPAYVEPDIRPGHYYVSVLDGSRRALLAGPWPTHVEALQMVDTVRLKACDLDARGHWYAFGTSRLPADGSTLVPKGTLNKHLGLPT